MTNDTTSTRLRLERDICAAFKGVVLGNGVSLSQAEIIDNYGKNKDGVPVSGRQYDDLRSTDVTEDWESITLRDLERDNVAHMDAEGLRYYLPALMISVLGRYDPASMRVIGTLMALDPRPMDEYHSNRYSLLNDKQKQVIAQFLTLLPDLLPLDQEDTARTNRAVKAYWQRFLPS